MSHMYGYKKFVGNTTTFHPIAVEDLGGGEFALNVVNKTIGVLKHYNGNAEVLEADITFSGITRSLIIENLHATQDILVSFDTGANFFIIKAGKSLELVSAITGLKIKASGAATPYQIITSE